MIEILIAIGILLGIFLVIYILGIIPNIYSLEVINPLSFDDVLLRGINIIKVLVFITIVLLGLYMVGSVVLTLI